MRRYWRRKEGAELENQPNELGPLTNEELSLCYILLQLLLSFFCFMSTQSPIVGLAPVRLSKYCPSCLFWLRPGNFGTGPCSQPCCRSRPKRPVNLCCSPWLQLPATSRRLHVRGC